MTNYEKHEKEFYESIHELSKFYDKSYLMEEKEEKSSDLNIYLISGVNTFHISPIASHFDTPIIGVKGIGEEFIPRELMHDIYSSKININLKNKEDYVKLLKLCIKYSEYIDYEELNK